jgi:cytochrome c peroxidase
MQSLNDLYTTIQQADVTTPVGRTQVQAQINTARIALKRADFWLRYLEPLAYRSINGPLPVEWETEVFEKFEKPYRREGAGLTLAALHLEEEQPQRDTLLYLIERARAAAQVFGADSITTHLGSFHHFYLCNRLFLLNLAAIYTTGFECPDATQVVPELSRSLQSASEIATAFNRSFPATPVPDAYLQLLGQAVHFVAGQPQHRDSFDHYTFIRTYVNPLYRLNQQLIRQYGVVSHSLVDYSLSKKAVSIFDKQLYTGQNAKGIFSRVQDSSTLAAIAGLGRQLFFDPILSGNNQRSCASCHAPESCFADTLTSSLHFNKQQHLARNTPSLVNAPYNHLLMQDGKHFTLQHQGKDVIANPDEMNCTATDALEKVMSCAGYRRELQKLLPYTPQEPEVSMEHVVSAITWYYSTFSSGTAPFDDAMNGIGHLTADAMQGFNLFMGKAQCATCHFVPQFNGVKPPCVGSEFEVIGVPSDTAYTRLSADVGRFGINPAHETRNAFRTGSLRNIARTAPYMHNGVFATLLQVVDFYDAGGGVGHGLQVPNQTLSADSLHLTATEKQQLLAFLHSLNESLPVTTMPSLLPSSRIKALNSRKPGGEY